MFDTTNSLSRTQFMLERGMDASLLRQNVIADNIANADTPYFKRSDVTFESQLKRAIDSHKNRPYPAKLTNARHIPFYQPMDYRQVRAKIQTENGSNFRNDKNNVDVEKEMVDAAKNALRYKAMAERLNRNYKKLLFLVR